jgi:hypothetical protein
MIPPIMRAPITSEFALAGVAKNRVVDMSRDEISFLFMSVLYHISDDL